MQLSLHKNLFQNLIILYSLSMYIYILDSSQYTLSLTVYVSKYTNKPLQNLVPCDTPKFHSLKHLEYYFMIIIVILYFIKHTIFPLPL